MSVVTLAFAGVAVAVQSGVALAATVGTPTRIVGGQSGRCLDVPNSSTTNGTQAQLWDCTGAASQTWTYTAASQLMVYGNKCLDASGRGTTNGTAVIIWDCNGQTNQQWNVNANGTITGVQSGLCLDANGPRHRQRHQGHPLGLQRPEQPAVDASRRPPRRRRRTAADRRRPVRHLRRGRHAVRRRAQHDARALRRVQRQPLPGPALLGQHDPEHRRAGRRRRRQRRGPGLVLRRHHVRHHGRLRPVRARQRPVVPGIQRGPGLAAEQPGEGDHRVADGRRQQGLLALHQPRQQLLARRPPDRRADRQRARGHVHGDQRHPRQQRLLLRLRQQRDRPARPTRAGAMDAIYFGTQLLVRRLLRHRPLGPGRPRVGPVPRRQPVLEPEPAGLHQQVRHRDAEEQRHVAIRASRAATPSPAA